MRKFAIQTGIQTDKIPLALTTTWRRHNIASRERRFVLQNRPNFSLTSSTLKEFVYNLENVRNIESIVLLKARRRLAEKLARYLINSFK